MARLPIAVIYPFFAADRRYAVALFLLAEVTDILDGVVARRRGTVSHTGAFADGWLDKVFHVNAAWSMILYEDIPAWWLLCWFSREIVQAAMIPFVVGPFLHGQVRPHNATALGKVTTGLLVAAFAAVFLRWAALAEGLTPLIGLLGVATSLQYLRRELAEAAELGSALAPPEKRRPPTAD